MPDIIKNNKLLFDIYFIILAAAMIPVLWYPKADVHLYINQFHTPFRDLFFKYVTVLGSGYAALILCIIFLFIRIRYSIITFTSWTITGLLVQFLKHIVFPDMNRPIRYFKDLAELNLVQGVELSRYFTFPSGHAATAFVLCFILALLSKRTWVRLLLILSAWIIAFSRVYLSQHFLEDILFGSLLGILSVIIFYWYFHRLKIPWADRTLQFHLRSKK
jgi:membrane-associated phospholipid phosphatase